MSEGLTVELRMRLSAADAHYGGSLVDGAHGLEIFGQIATELAVRTDGDEGLFAGYARVEFLAPMHAGDFVRATGTIVKMGNTSRTVDLELWKEITARTDVNDGGRPARRRRAGSGRRDARTASAGTCGSRRSRRRRPRSTPATRRTGSARASSRRTPRTRRRGPSRASRRAASSTAGRSAAVARRTTISASAIARIVGRLTGRRSRGRRPRPRAPSCGASKRLARGPRAACAIAARRAGSRASATRASARRAGCARRHEHRVLAVGHELGDAADAGRDDGQAERERLHERDRQALVVRGQAEHVERRHDPHRVGAEAEELEAVAEAEPVVLLARARARAGPGRRRRTARGRRASTTSRGGDEQVGVALGGPEVGHRTDQDLVVGDAEASRAASARCSPSRRISAASTPYRTTRVRARIRAGSDSRTAAETARWISDAPGGEPVGQAGQAARDSTRRCAP